MSNYYVLVIAKFPEAAGELLTLSCSLQAAAVELRDNQDIVIRLANVINFHNIGYRSVPDRTQQYRPRAGSAPGEVPGPSITLQT